MTFSKSNVPSLKRDQKNKIINELYDHYYYQDNPPALQLIIPEQMVKYDPYETEYLTAMLKYYVDANGRKESVAHITFKITDSGSVIKETLAYHG